MTASAVWGYFEKVPDKKSRAKCLICHKQYSHRSSITNLKKHLIYKHFDVYQNYVNINKSLNEVTLEEDTSENLLSDYEQVKAEFNSSPEPEVHGLDINTETPDLSGPRPKRSKQKQNVNVYIACYSDQQKKKIDKKLLEMIIRNYEPFSIVEDESFHSFIKELNPNYELPNRKLLSGTLISEQFIACKMKIKEIVKNAKNVCITIDTWNSLIKDSYLTVTAHFVVDFQLKTIMLHCEQFTSSHTDNDLTNCLQNIVQEYDISDKITLAVSNNDHKIRNAIEKNQWLFFSCFLQRINLIIEKAVRVIDFILEKVNRVVGHVKRNITAANVLLEYQKDSGKRSPLKLIQSVPKRWNSIFYMLERFLKLQGALENVILKLELDSTTITIENWETIKQICMILRPFEEVTRIMSTAHYLSGSLVLIIVDGLNNTINVMKTKSIHGVAKLFLENLEEGLKTYFPEKEMKDNMLLAVCTFVDPRFKIHAFLDHKEVEKHVIELIKNKILEKQQTINDNIEIYPIKPQDIEVSEETEPISIWVKINENIVANTPSDDISIKAKKELEMFLNDKLLHRDSCPLTWWKENALIYPNLSEIFIEHYQIVVTSVKCETVFTKAANILAEKRASLSRKHTTELVFLHNNIDFCEWE